MPRLQWADLPGPAREAIQRQVGTVHHVVSAEDGLTPGVAAHLHTTGGRAFVKAVPVRSPAAHHYEVEEQVKRCTAT